MKNLRLLALASLLTAVIPANAAFESARLAPDNDLPRFPLVLQAAGVTKGFAVIALSIDADGRVKDTLPLAYTQPAFVRASVEVMRNWRFEPARLDGAPVPVQTELRIDYTLEGAVITTNILNHFLYDSFETLGDNAVAYHPGRASRLDHQPVRVAGAAPKYSALAERDGVRGTVKVRFYIDEQGVVRMPAAEADHAHPYLLEEAVAAVRTWKFEPVTSGGAPVLVAASQEFNFGPK